MQKQQSREYVLNSVGVCLFSKHFLSSSCCINQGPLCLTDGARHTARKRQKHPVFVLVGANLKLINMDGNTFLLFCVSISAMPSDVWTSSHCEEWKVISLSRAEIGSHLMCQDYLSIRRHDSLYNEMIVEIRAWKIASSHFACVCNSNSFQFFKCFDSSIFCCFN